jgi:hypothetical protein
MRLSAKKIIGLILFVTLVLTTGHAGGATTEVRGPETVAPDSPFNIDLLFFDTDFYAVSDIDLIFDSGIISFQSWFPGADIIAFGPTDMLPISTSAPFTGNLPVPAEGLLIASVTFEPLTTGPFSIDVDPTTLFLSTSSTIDGIGIQVPVESITLVGDSATVVPLPATVWLLGSALCMIIGLRRSFFRRFM